MGKSPDVKPCAGLEDFFLFFPFFKVDPGVPQMKGFFSKNEGSQDLGDFKKFPSLLVP